MTAVTMLRDVRVDKRDNDVVEELRDTIALPIWKILIPGVKISRTSS